MKYFSMFSGIGGFELGIQQAYENLSKTERTQQGRVEKNSTDIKQSRLATKQSIGLWSNSPWSRKKLGNTKNSRIVTDDTGRWRRTQQATCIGYSEINKYAIQIYEKHFNHKNYGDATAIIPGQLPDFDLLVGGFPCQAFSIAGKRQGFNDTRGTLFFDIERILSVKKPANFVLENVKGLLSHDNGRTFKTIITTLAELGYDIEWQVLNSKNFGVPQNRERVFIIGHLRGTPRPEVFPIGQSNKNIDEGNKERQEQIADTITTRYSSRNGRGTHLKQIIGGGQGNRVYDPSGISSTIASQAGGRGAKTGLYAVLTPDRLVKRQNGRRFKTNGEPSFTLTGQDIHGVSDGMEIRRLTPRECERLQGFPDNWTAEGIQGKISDNQRYKMLGNAVTVNVVKYVITKLYERTLYSPQQKSKTK